MVLVDDSRETTAATSATSSILASAMDKDVENDGVGLDVPLAIDSSSEHDTAGIAEKAGEAVNVASSQPVNLMDPSSFPDGGTKAWTVVFGAFCGLIVSFGWINCIGVFQAYYETHQLKQYTSQEVAWIPSSETCVMFLGGLWVGRVYDNYGPRYLLLAGTFFHVFGLMMASISKTYYQFILSQGVCSALGASMIFYPCMNSVTTWFFHRRALALGITASGSSIGGVIFPIMVERLIPQVGFGWTMRICAFLILGLMVIVNLTLVSRIPPKPKPVRLMDFVVPFKESPFALLSLGTFFTWLGLFVPLTFIILAARANGVPNSIAAYLVAICNGASTFGRTVPPFLADRMGRFNVFLVSCLLTTLITLCLWVPATGTPATIVFALVFGFGSGAVASLLPACVAQISNIHEIGVRTGALFSVAALATLIGSPVAGQIVTKSGYRSMQGFGGAILATGFIVYVVLWVRLGGLKWKKV